MKKIIIDCDPGHDDAVAIVVAHSEAKLLDVLAVGSVGGNHHLDKITKNAQLVLQTLGVNTPLYKGCYKPLVQALPIQPGAHGDSGMDGLEVTPEIIYPIQTTHAVEAYRDLLMKNEEVTIVALGPLTNIATLLQMYPEVKENIFEISLMGGGVDHGNVTPYAEFNIFADPEAARIVFESGLPIIMCGLDVTEDAFLSFDDIQSLKGLGNVSQFTHELLMFYYESGKQFGFDVAAMHDATAVCVLTQPNLFTYKEYHIEISCDGITRGMTCADKRKRPGDVPNVRVVMGVDQPRFAQYLLEMIQRADAHV